MKTKPACDDMARGGVSAQPHFHQSAREIQSYGTVQLLPIGLDEPVWLEMTEQINLLMAGAMTLCCCLSYLLAVSGGRTLIGANGASRRAR